MSLYHNALITADQQHQQAREATKPSSSLSNQQPHYRSTSIFITSFKHSNLITTSTMHMNKAIAAAILAFCASGVIAAPLPQLAGEGAAADSIISQTDNGVGYGTENALDNLAGNVNTVKGAVPAVPAVRRQLAGEGAAADSIISQTDNGVGYGTENALDNLAGNVNTVKGAVPAVPAARAVRRQLGGEGAAANSIISDTDNGVGYGTENALDAVASDITTTKGQLAAVHARQLGGEGAAADSIISDTDNGVGYGTENALDAVAGDITTTKGQAPAARRRQLDKISNGVAAVSNAAGTGAVTKPVTDAGDSTDGSLTSGAANAGAQIGDTEASTLEAAGAAVPKFRRQLDKISNGVAAVSNAAGTGAVTAPVTDAGDSTDGTLTSGAANAGAQIGNTEASTLESAGSAVPKFRRQLDKVSNGVATLSNSLGTGATTSSVTNAGTYFPSLFHNLLY
jgi:hypothetical protein